MAHSTIDKIFIRDLSEMIWEVWAEMATTPTTPPEDRVDSIFEDLYFTMHENNFPERPARDKWYGKGNAHKRPATR